MSPTDVREEPGAAEARALITLAHALRALRDFDDPHAMSAIAGQALAETLGAREYRLLRHDSRTGALFCSDESGLETPYAAEPDGSIERAMRSRQPVFLDKVEGTESCEALLWTEEPASMAAMPLVATGRVRGVLLVGFEAPRQLDIRDRTLIQALADALAVAFERAELSHTARQATEGRRRLSRRLEEGADTASHLMSVVAHEIRSPLTAIKAYSEALRSSLMDSTAPRERFLEVINDECDRLGRLVTDILDLSRLETGLRPLRLARVEVEPLVREVGEALRSLLRGRHVALDLEIEAGLTVEADPDLLRRLIQGLLENAIEHSPGSGFVRVSAKAEDGEWNLWVQDQGPAIAAADLPKVFDRFFRARPLDSEGAMRHGLGLAIARGIVEVHGGRVAAESIEPAGVRLWVRLPQRQLVSTRARLIARRLLRHPEVRRLFHQAIERIARLVDAGIVSLMEIDPDRGDFVVTGSRGLDGHHLLGRRTVVRAGVAGVVAAYGRPLLVQNIETDPRFQRLNHPQYTTKSLLCAPVRVSGEVLAVFNVTNPNDGRAFVDDDLLRLDGFVDRLGGALERFAVDPESSSALAEAVSGPSTPDPVAPGARSIELVRATARELGTNAAEEELLGYVAGLLFAGVPTANGDVDAPVDTVVELVRPPDYLARVGRLLLGRHENWDGSGHPLGLAGEQIPLGSRVLAVVSEFASLAAENGSGPERELEAIAALREESGQRLDPAVVDALARAVSGAEKVR